ncbi:MAG: aa3-type cytochrome c oxidase subunit IV [Pseudodonghicola sp.]
MADFKHGAMNITEQTKTYEGFIKFVTWAVVFLAVLAVFMAVFLT